jgi:hypothetical protein
MNPLTKTTCIAASLFVLGAFILNQGVVALRLILVTMLVFSRGLWARRAARRLYEQRLA